MTVCDSWQCLSMENQFSIETLVNVYSRNLMNDVWTFQSISKHIYFLRDILRYSLVLIDNTHILNTKSLFQELETHFCLLHKNLVKLVLSLYVLVFSVKKCNPTQSEIVLLCSPPQKWNLTLSEIAPLLSTSISRNSDFTSFNEILSQFSSSPNRISWILW